MASAETERGSPTSRHHNDGRRAAGLVFADLDNTSASSNIEPGAFRSSQIATLYGTLPLFVLSNIIVMAVFAAIAKEQLHLPIASWWFVFSLLPVILLIVLWGRHNTAQSKIGSLAEIRWIQFIAVLFGISWALCPALFFAAADPNLRILIVGITLAASAIGTFALARVPAAAILYSALITSSLAISVNGLDGQIGLTFTIFTVSYGFILTGMVLNYHRDQLQKAIDAQEAQQKNEIIALLLNDFEQGTSDWLWECDADGLLIYASPRFSEIVHKSSQELRSLTLLQAANATPSQTGWKRFIGKMLAREPVVACHLEIINAGQKTYWSINARPLFGCNDMFKGYRGVGRDITAEWETDRKLTEAKEIAEAASAAKSHFLAVMSHELRTPLNSIVGFSEILSARSEGKLDADVRLDYARTILESSKHLQTLINDILDASRIENGTIALVEQDIYAAELVEIVVKMCRDQAEKADVTLVAKLADGIELRADITRTKQIILNLLVNAIKFSSAGGVVNVELLRTRDDRFAISIRDGGIGIRSEDLARIFEPFVQAEEGMSRRFSGVGLGLSIARKIARLHGGEVTLTSQFGVGTTARFELPAARVTWPARAAQAGQGVAA